MADYQSLLTRAVANLPNASAAAARQAIYDRARTALVNQLRSLHPPLPDSDIEREERALDKAIAQVELQFRGARSGVGRDQICGCPTRPRPSAHPRRHPAPKPAAPAGALAAPPASRARPGATLGSSNRPSPPSAASASPDSAKAREPAAGRPGKVRPLRHLPDLLVLLRRNRRLNRR